MRRTTMSTDRDAIRRRKAPLAALVVSAVLIPLSWATPATATAAPPVLFGPPTVIEGRVFDPQLADVDEDGLLDLLAIGFDAEPYQLEVRPGDGRGGFGVATSFPVGGAVARMVLADVNGDTVPDVVVTLADAGVAVLLADGTGAFGAPRQFPVNGVPYFVNTGDVDADGDVDIVVGTRNVASADNQVRVLPGDGAGSFGPDLTVLRSPAGYSNVEVGDLNGDRRADIVVTAAFERSTAIRVVLSRQRAFDPPVVYPSGQGIIRSDLADVDLDGALDLVALDSAVGPGLIRVRLGDGLGGLGPERTSPAPADRVGTEVEVADVTADGLPDLVANDDDTDSTSTAVQVGDGAGHFGAPTAVESGVAAGTAVAIGDFAGDSEPDLIVVGGLGGIASLVNLAGSSSVVVTDAAASEDAGSLVFVLTRSGNSVAAGSTSFRTADGTASAPSDYAARLGRVTFAPGQTTAQIRIPVVDDAVDEVTERMRLILGQPVGLVLGDGVGTGRILDDD